MCIIYIFNIIIFIEIYLNVNKFHRADLTWTKDFKFTTSDLKFTSSGQKFSEFHLFINGLGLLYSLLIKISLYVTKLSSHQLKISMKYTLLQTIDYGDDDLIVPMVCSQLINKYLGLETIEASIPLLYYNIDTNNLNGVIQDSGLIGAVKASQIGIEHDQDLRTINNFIYNKSSSILVRVHFWSRVGWIPFWDD